MPSPFDQLASRHDLSYAPQGRLLVAGSIITGQKATTSDVVGGVLPGGIEGVVAKAEVQVRPSLRDSAIESATLGLKQPSRMRRVEVGSGENAHVQYFRDLNVLVTRVPNAGTFLPYVVCRDARFSGLVDRLIGPGGLIPVVQQYDFESIELNRRYRIGIRAGLSENRLRQLFEPAFVDWMASTAPDGFAFELAGTLLCVCGAGPPGGADDLERFCELSAHVADRIGAEALETAQLAPAPGVLLPARAPAENAARSLRERQLASVQFREPPTNAAKAARHFRGVALRESRNWVIAAVFSMLMGLIFGAIVGFFTIAILGVYAAAVGAVVFVATALWFFTAVLRSATTRTVQDLGLAAVVRAYATQRGLTLADQGDARLLASQLLLPVQVTEALTGRLPGAGSDGGLLIVPFPADGKPGASIVALLPVRADHAPGPLRILPAQAAANIAFLGGVLVAVAAAPRLGERDRATAEVAARLSRQLGAEYTVLQAPPAADDVPAELIAWMRAADSAGRRLVVVDDRHAALVGASAPLDAFTHEHIDEFCSGLGALAPALHSRSPTASTGRAS